MKGIIIYKGKYEATRQYAEWLGLALGFPVLPAGLEKKEQIANASHILIGSSIYIGKLQMREWLKENQLLLADKKVFLFMVAGTPPGEKEKLNGYFKDNVPLDMHDKIRCYFLPGKLEFKKLNLVDKLLLKMGSMLAKQSGETISTADYNEVRRENIAAMIEDVEYEFNHQSVLHL